MSILSGKRVHFNGQLVVVVILKIRRLFFEKLLFSLRAQHTARSYAEYDDDFCYQQASKWLCFLGEIEMWVWGWGVEMGERGRQGHDDCGFQGGLRGARREGNHFPRIRSFNSPIPESENHNFPIP